MGTIFLVGSEILVVLQQFWGNIQYASDLKMERESTSRLTLDDVCGKEPKNFKKDRLFQNHYRTHAEEKFVCKECPSVWSGGPENTFNTKKQLSSHMHEYHKSNKDCDQCSKSFSCSTNRIAAIAHEATHSYSNMFECQSCDKLM